LEDIIPDRTGDCTMPDTGPSPCKVDFGVTGITIDGREYGGETPLSGGFITACEPGNIVSDVAAPDSKPILMSNIRMNINTIGLDMKSTSKKYDPYYTTIIYNSG